MQHTKLRAVPKALAKLILEYRNKLQHERRILWAYGFDLSPLAARHDEFCQLAAAFEQREATVRGLKREISSGRRDVLTLVDLGLANMPGVADWNGTCQRL